MSATQSGAIPAPALPGGASSAMVAEHALNMDDGDEDWSEGRERELLESQRERLHGAGERDDDESAWSELDERALLDAGEPALSEARAQFGRGEIALDRYVQRLVHAHSAPRDAPGWPYETASVAGAAPLRKAGVDDPGHVAPADSSRRDRPPAQVEDALVSRDQPTDGPLARGAPARKTRPAKSDRTVLGGRFELEEWLGRDETSDIYRSRDLLAAMYDGPPIVRLRLLRRTVTENDGRLTGALRALAHSEELPLRHRNGELHRFEDDYLIVSDWPEVAVASEPASATFVAGEERNMRIRGRIAVLALSVLVTWVVTREQPGVLPARQPTGPAMAVAPAPLAAPAMQPQLSPPEAASPQDVIRDIPPVVLAAPVTTAPTTKRTRGAARPVVGFAARRVVAGEGTRFVLLRVKSTGSLRQPLRLSVNAVSGAATVNQDFVPPAASLTLTRQRPAADVLVSLLADDVPEYTEDFTVALGIEHGDARLGNASSVVVITDDD